MNLFEYFTTFLPVVAICSILLALSIKIYVNLWRKFPTSVNCWFCNEWSKVLHEYKNSWYCRNCDQYNGFTPDGDYNKPMPEHEDEFMNPALCVSKAKVANDNGLCVNCNNNQQLKIRQLAMFCPLNESRFDEEIESYKLQLERAYRLCQACENVVKQTLTKQKTTLLGLKLNSIREKGLSFIVTKTRVTSTVIKYSIITLAVINLSDALMKLTDTLPGVLQPYVHLGKDLTILIRNFIYENILYYTQSLLSTSFFYFIRDYMFGFYPTLKQIDLEWANVDQTMLSVILGFVLQAYLCVNGNKKMEGAKALSWVLLYVDHAYIDSKYIQAATSVFIIFASLAKRNRRKPTKMNVSTSTFQSDKTVDFNASFTPQKIYDASALPSFTSKKIESDTLHMFGQRPLFDNPLRVSPVYRSSSPNSLNSSSSTKLNESFCSVVGTPRTTIVEPDEWDLYKGFSNLRLGTIPAKRNAELPSMFRVISPSLKRTKPILSPPRLRNVTQASWVAGGYWKPNDYLPLGSFTNLSRSSSQSSGFGSQTSNQLQTNDNIFSSLPSSCNNSVCDFDKSSVLSEPAYQYPKGPSIFNSRLLQNREAVISPSVYNNSVYSAMSRGPTPTVSALSDICSLSLGTQRNA